MCLIADISEKFRQYPLIAEISSPNKPTQQVKLQQLDEGYYDADLSDEMLKNFGDQSSVVQIKALMNDELIALSNPLLLTQSTRYSNRWKCASRATNKGSNAKHRQVP